MTGIMAAVAGGLSNTVYGSGLYGPTGAQSFTITSSGTSAGGSTVSINYTWIGYLLPSVSGTDTLSINSIYTQFINYFGTTQYAWGGGPSSVSRLWVGNNAISGYNNGNANATANNTTATYAPSLTANTYYPVRYNWVATLPYSATAYFDGVSFYPGWTTGSCSFGVSNGAGYYNLVTNGF